MLLFYGILTMSALDGKGREVIMWLYIWPCSSEQDWTYIFRLHQYSWYCTTNKIKGSHWINVRGIILHVKLKDWIALNAFSDFKLNLHLKEWTLYLRLNFATNAMTFAETLQYSITFYIQCFHFCSINQFIFNASNFFSINQIYIQGFDFLFNKPNLYLYFSWPTDLLGKAV